MRDWRHLTCPIHSCNDTLPNLTSSSMWTSTPSLMDQYSLPPASSLLSSQKHPSSISITQNDVHEAFTTSFTHKAAGCDEICPVILQKCVLAPVTNECMDSSSLPTDMKTHAIIMPHIHMCVTILRTDISLLCILSKVFESSYALLFTKTRSCLTNLSMHSHCHHRSF